MGGRFSVAKPSRRDELATDNRPETVGLTPDRPNLSFNACIAVGSGRLLSVLPAPLSPESQLGDDAAVALDVFSL